MKRKQNSRMVGAYSSWKAPQQKPLQQLDALARWGQGKDGTDARSKPRQQQFNERLRLG